MTEVFGRLPLTRHRRWSGYAPSRYASRPFGGHRTIAGDLLFLILFPLAVWLALVVTP